jgi:hypothetical protein
MSCSLNRSRNSSRGFFVMICVLSTAGCHHPITWTSKPPYPSATTTNDFDLKWDKSDPNGSPSNPRWAPQSQNKGNLPPTKDSNCSKNSQPYQAGCTNQANDIVQDRGTGITGFFCNLFGDAKSINGHADWTVASANGAIGWLNYADDWDYNLLLVPNDDNGLTANNNSLADENQKYIEIEFDSRELEGRFETKWWNRFAQLASAVTSSGNYDDIVNYLHAGPGLACGTVFGVFGIDCEHGCRSEYHPAYGVAVQIDESNSSNRWAIFARNWGDEGFCSSLNHLLDLKSSGGAMRLLLPYNSKSEPTNIKLEEAASSSSPGICPRFAFSKGEGELVEIPLPPPGMQGMTELVVDLIWPNDATPSPCKSIDKTNLMKMLATRKAGEVSAPKEESSEEHVGRLFRSFNQNKGFSEMDFRQTVLQPYSAQLSPRQQQTAQLNLSELRNNPLQCTIPEVVSRTKMTANEAPERKKLAPLVKHTQKPMWDQAMMTRFCGAYEAAGRKLPPGESADLAKRLDKECKKYLAKH